MSLPIFPGCLEMDRFSRRRCWAWRRGTDPSSHSPCSLSVRLPDTDTPSRPAAPAHGDRRVASETRQRPGTLLPRWQRPLEPCGLSMPTPTSRWPRTLLAGLRGPGAPAGPPGWRKDMACPLEALHQGKGLVPAFLPGSPQDEGAGTGPRVDRAELWLSPGYWGAERRSLAVCPLPLTTPRPGLNLRRQPPVRGRHRSIQSAERCS